MEISFHLHKVYTFRTENTTQKCFLSFIYAPLGWKQGQCHPRIWGQTSPAFSVISDMWIRKYKYFWKMCYLLLQTIHMEQTVEHLWLGNILLSKSHCVVYQMLQAISVIHTDNMIRVAIRHALGYRHGYSHKAWMFSFSLCSAAANNAICAGHCATGAIHNMHSCVNSVMEQTIPLLRRR